MARQKFSTRRDAAFDCGSEWIIGNPSLTGLWKVGPSLGSDGQKCHQIPRRLPKINDTLSVFRVDSSGRVYADGGFQPNGADFAESVAVTGQRSAYAAGDLLVIDAKASRHVALAQQPYSPLVAGIYSTKPGMLGTTRGVDEPAAKDEVPLAVVGIVPCKVSTENGAIEAGDLLVTSATPGHAMKGTDRSKMLGAVVGKALEPLAEGKGVIQVLVTLQ
jgi:hypothetical protein